MQAFSYKDCIDLFGKKCDLFQRLVYVFPVSNANHGDDADFLCDFVDDAICPHSNTIKIPPSMNLDASNRMRIFRERAKGMLNISDN